MNTGALSVEIDDIVYSCPETDIDGEMRPMNDFPERGVDEVLIGSLKGNVYTAATSMVVYPNPFTTGTTLEFQIDRSGELELSLHDIFTRDGR